MNNDTISDRIVACFLLILQALLDAILLIPVTILLLIEMIWKRRSFKAFAHDWNTFVTVWAFVLNEGFKYIIGKISIEELNRTVQEVQNTKHFSA